ncbi:MAG: Fe-S cluster assembly protein SufD [Gemmatimonadota bacterium]
MTETTTAEVPRPAPPDAPGDRFEAFLAALEEPGALREARRAAWRRYAALPMPDRKTEEWRYTDVSGLRPASFRSAAAAGVEAPPSELPGEVREALARSGERAALTVVRNGRAVEQQLDPALAAQGVVFAPIVSVARERPELLWKHLFRSPVAAMEEKLWKLHTAMLSDGYLLYVPREVRVERPVHAFRYLDREGVLVSSHTLIVAEAGAEVTCIDEHLSPDLPAPSLSLAGVEIVGGENAGVRYVCLQRYGRGVEHFSIQHVAAGRDARLLGFNVALGADLARADVTSRLRGPGSESQMLALWFGDREQHVDFHTLQHHEAPHATSDLLYKGALTDAARGVFRGLIRVEPGAQFTDAYQTNRNMLLSETAKATSLPNLEIEADDVRCSHGATIGQVDEAQLFYLMTRGLTRKQAERLLVFGFFDEVLNRLPVTGVRARVREAIEEKIQLHG